MTVRLVEWGGPIPEIENARQSWSERRGILLVLDDGFGEATPLPGYGGGTLEEANRALGELDLASLVELSEPEAIARAVTTSVPSARFCLETALCDRLARRRGIALSDLLAGVAISRSVATSHFGGTLENPTIAQTAPLKLKAKGLDLPRERHQLSSLRREIGDRELRLDLNGGLDVESARRALELYAEFGVRWVEEPVAGHLLLELGRSSVPWLADESLSDPELADELLKLDTCAGVVVKPTLLGLFGARSLALRALERGKVALVSHAFEGPVALAACAELALSLGLREATGVERHAALVAFPRCQLPQLAKEAEIAPVPRRGLGITWQ